MKYKNLKATFNIIGLAIVVFLVIREFGYLVLSRLPFGEGSVIATLLYIAVFIASCLAPVIMMENTLGMHPKLFGKTDLHSGGGAVMQGYLFILAAGIINSFVLSLLKLAGLEFAVRELVMPDGFVRMAVYYIYVCVLPPLLEEIFVRGYVLNALKGYGVTFAVVASSVCFALMHSSLENFVVYFACGVILAMVYLTFDSLLPAMALHWVNNSISFFLAFYRQKVNAVSALSLTVFVYVFVLIMGFVGHRLLARHDIMLTDCLSKETDAKGKLRQFGKSYVAITALALLLFLSAVGSYNSLI